ncbi:MAG: hypothetical protein AB8G99_23135 [Planctomycetaceae bacterium]
MTTLFTNPKHIRGDLRTVEQGLKRGWEIPDHILESLPLKLAAIIDGTSSTREKIAASRVLVQMQKSSSVTEPDSQATVASSTPLTLEQRKIELLKRLDRIRNSN